MAVSLSLDAVAASISLSTAARRVGWPQAVKPPSSTVIVIGLVTFSLCLPAA